MKINIMKNNLISNKSNKLFILLLFLTFFTIEQSPAQSISLSNKTLTLKEAFTEIEKQTNLSVDYNREVIDVTKTVSIPAQNGTLDAIMTALLKGTGCIYTIKENHLIISAVTSGLPSSSGKKISGTITDASGEPIIGANVIEKGTTNGVITDIDGIFHLTVQENATIYLSYIGYASQEVVVGNNTEFRITLKEDSKTLEEVVVVSYGTQKKRDMTGAIASVKADALADLPVGQIGQKLQGQVAGVQINQSTGIPGQGIAFRIRGAVSINNDSQPLIVVDGFPIAAGLNNINPDEIETFTVLKDAAATSLYGSRAGNGVILITTKRGKKGKLDVKLQVNVGVQTLEGLKDMDVMNAREFAQFKKEYFEDAIKWGDRDASLGVPQQYQNPEQYGAGTNWYKLLTQNALTQNYSLGLSGGTDAIATAVTFGYFNQEGVVKNSGFERMTLRTNNDFRVNEKIKIGLNVSPMIQLHHNLGTDGDRAILSGAMIADPTESPYDANGNLRLSLSPTESGTGMFPQVNWLRAISERKAEYRILTMLANAFVDIDIWDGIKYRFQAGTDMEWRKYNEWTPSTAAGSWNSPAPDKASAKYNNENYYTWNVENMLTYDKTFQDHTISVLAGYSAQKYRWEKAAITGGEFPDDEVEWITKALTTRLGETEMKDWTIASWLARVDYTFKERYLLQANIRRDGSSRFGTGNKWATFPSVSAGWIISEESFMESSANILNYLKLRTSYGITGNYNIGDYTHLATVTAANYPTAGEVAPGKGLSGIGNQKLTWEENKQFDIGVDFGFLNDRIFMMYDYYQKRTEMLLNEMEIPWTSGFEKVMSNMGEIKSWGHEVSLESRNMIGAFKWNTKLNLTFNRNKVIKFSAQSNHTGGDSEYGNWNRLEVGQPVGIFMGYVFDGVYMNQAEYDAQPKHYTSKVGSVRMKDISGPSGVPDGIIDINDRTKIGDPNPDMIFGITNEFRWKNFDLSFLFTGQIGGDIFAGCFENTLNLDGAFNVLKDVKNRWRSEENPGNGRIPSTMPNTTELYRANHSGWVYDGTHLTLKNLTFGYTVPFKRNSFVSSARVYFSAQQLFTLCSYPGINPQVSTNNELGWNGMGVDRTTYPIPRTFSLGCNINF